MKKALIIVDVQNDFCEGGSLAVPNANSIIPYINLLMKDSSYDQIILTQDFHPANHKSFASNNHKKVGEIIDLNGTPQFMWPNHCVEGTLGAEFHKDLKIEKVTHIVQKGKNPEVDSYSAFYDNDKLVKTDLTDFLKFHDIELVEIVGLALDFCVKYTCIDASNEGFITCMHFHGTKPVFEDKAKDAIYEMIQNRVTILG